MTAPTPHSRTPLSQALARKNGSPLPAILIVVGLLAAIGFALFGYLESQRTEPVVVLTHDVPYGQQLRADDLGTIELPLHRPAQLAGISSQSAIIGQYAARNLGTNDLVQPTMLMAEPPTQPVYPNGEQLTVNMVPLPFSTITVGPITFRDRINLGFNDPSGDPALCDQALSAAGGKQPTLKVPQTSAVQPRAYACRLLSAVRVLYVDTEQGVAYLELSPYQAHTVWALQAAGLQLWGERYGITSEPLGVLNRLDIGQVNHEDLTKPVPTAQPHPEGVSTSVLPGDSSVIPGAVQP